MPFLEHSLPRESQEVDLANDVHAIMGQIINYFQLILLN